MAATTAMFLTGAETYNTISQQRRQASALRSQGSYEAAAFDRNASLAEAQAADALARGGVAAGIRGRQVRSEVGSARAAMAASGIQLDTGSALDVQADIDALGALDVATIRNNAAREAWGYRTQASDLTQRGILSRLAAENAAAGLDDDQITTLLTGAGKTYGLFRQSRDGGRRVAPEAETSRSRALSRLNEPANRPRVRDINPGKMPGVATLPIPKAKRPPGTY